MERITLGRYSFADKNLDLRDTSHFEMLFYELVCFRRQIKADHVPHYKVFVECLKHRSK
jgi:hypothetical protein